MSSPGQEAGQNSEVCGLPWHRRPRALTGWTRNGGPQRLAAWHRLGFSVGRWTSYSSPGFLWS